MSRFAARRRVFFIEEAVRESIAAPDLRVRTCEKSGVRVVTPVLPADFAAESVNKAVSKLVASLFRKYEINSYITWFYTPMALDYCGKLNAGVTVYDCMDELSLFDHASPRLRENEKKLFSLADLVFTGGISLFEAKVKQHNSVYAFPSSLDFAHFAQARTLKDTPADQNGIPRPRIGYAGVIDERIDLKLISEAAASRPDWQFVMIGPVVKIDQAALPRMANIHWLGMKDYDLLPAYFAGWDLAMMPFAMNDSTRYISPTKTPEYLAAGLSVVSTPVRDVVRQYGEIGLVGIASDSAEFVAKADRAMSCCMGMKWRQRADAFVGSMSWDRTWHSMNTLIEERIESRRKPEAATAVAASFSFESAG